MNVDAIRGLPAAVGIGILAGVVAAIVWMLVATQIAIVPDGMDYPANWTMLTSMAQVDWLRENMVVLSGFAALEYMVTHFSKYASNLYRFFGESVFSALCASVLYWYIRRDRP